MLHLSTYIFCTLILVSTHLKAEPRKSEMEGIELFSDKNDEVRIYKGSFTKIVNRQLHAVKESIINFEDKCNNELSRKRIIQDREKKCSYFNENLIESFITREFKNSIPKLEGEVDRFIIGRRAYNRGLYTHYEMTTETHGKNENNQKTVLIVQDMIPQDKINDFLSEPKFENNSAFRQTRGKFLLTEIESGKTQIEYEYYAETKHWILNKEISVSQVFASMGKSLIDLWESIDQESEKITRTIASKP